MKTVIILNQIANSWNKLPLIVRSLLTGFTVSSIGITIWSALLSGINVPWSIPPMIVALWAYLKFFSGKWGPKKNSETRKFNFRSTKLHASTWKWGLLAAVLFVIIVQASFVITFRLVNFPSEKFTADYKILETMPLWLALVVLIMGSIVAGICEETGFRGYMQTPLEKRYGSTVAIVITSIVFMLIHLSHSWALPILPHIFFASVLLGILAFKTGSLIPGIIGHSLLDIFDYSFWWSTLFGGFQKQTISKTGVDLHFIVWSLIFMIAVFMFFRCVRRLNKKRNATSSDSHFVQLNFQ
jgi:Predicted metal-dependent membrane protease